MGTKDQKYELRAFTSPLKEAEGISNLQPDILTYNSLYIRFPGSSEDQERFTWSK